MSEILQAHTHTVTHTHTQSHLCHRVLQAHQGDPGIHAVVLDIIRAARLQRTVQPRVPAGESKLIIIINIYGINYNY